MDVVIRPLGATAAPPSRGPVVRPSLPVDSVQLAQDAWQPSAVAPSGHPAPDPLRQLGTAVAVALVAVAPMPGLAQALESKESQTVSAPAPQRPATPPPPAILRQDVAAPVVLTTLEEPAPPASTPQAPATPAATTQANVAALQLPGTSKDLDDARSYDVPWAVQERTFGHDRVAGQLFDRSGNWADTGTAVTADQAAAMPEGQRRQLGADLRLGNAERALVRPAAGEVKPGQVVDQGRSVSTRSKDGLRNFGHDPVHGRLFQGNAWADDGGLVSADQVAAMELPQRNSFARSAGVAVSDLRLGDPARVLVEPAPVQASPFDGLPADRIVTADGFRMRADTARAYHRLKALIAEAYPGRPVRITSTMGGRHTDPGHREGRAVDFVVEPLTNKESRAVEALAWQAGFRPYNEYVHSSPYKTGPHMHVTLPKAR